MTFISRPKTEKKSAANRDCRLGSASSLMRRPLPKRLVWKQNKCARKSAAGKRGTRQPNLPKRKSADDFAWGSSGKDARFLNKLRRLLSKSDEADRKLLLHMAQKVARPRAGRGASN